MASPPYYQNFASSVSPPYPSHSQLPASKKRPSELHGNSSAKRRKPSTSSALSHPLRQTSFPPEGGEQYSPNARSPSIDTMSLVSGSVVASGKKKRGRKPKNAAQDDASVAGGKALTAVSGTSGRNRRVASRGMSIEDDDDEAGVDMDVAVAARTNEEKEKEAHHRMLLVNSFNRAQEDRYEVWRSSKLSDAVVRKLINQTLSQSVPASIVLAVKSVTKIFAGEIIERARKVQTQWLEEEDQSGLPSPPPDSDESSKATRRPPLMPDHLREALRRYKLERDGGFVGLLNLDRSQHPGGTERFGLRAMGRRLLR